MRHVCLSFWRSHCCGRRDIFNSLIEPFHSRGQEPCTLIGTKLSTGKGSDPKQLVWDTNMADVGKSLCRENNNSARVSRFFVHFFAITARLRCQLPNFTYHRQREHTTTNFSFSPTLNIFFKNSTPGQRTKWACWDNRTEVSKNAKSLFMWRFRPRHRCGILNSLL